MIETKYEELNVFHHIGIHERRFSLYQFQGLVFEEVMITLCSFIGYESQINQNRLG